MPFGDPLTFQRSRHVKKQLRVLKMQERGTAGKVAGKGPVAETKGKGREGWDDANF